MANTYLQLFIQTVFVVKGRTNLITNDFKEELYKYITGILTNREHKLLQINGMPDHIHLLISFNPTDSLSSLVKEIKRCSTNFINEKKFVIGKFEWQSGYGAFSYSKSQVNTVCKYIANQEFHHKKKTFRQEYIEFLKKFEIEFNEQYIFEDV